MQFLPCLFAVGSIINIVVPSKNGTEDLTVDRFILHNKNSSFYVFDIVR